MTPDRIALMPDWPARMGEDLASLYLGVSMTTFRARVASYAYPQPIRDGKRKLWSREQLDRFVCAQFGLQHRDNSWDDVDGGEVERRFLAKRGRK